MTDMYKYNVNGQVITTPFTREEIAMRVGKSSAYIKTVVGIGNNAAWAAALEAHDHARKHPNYRHKVKHAFKAAMAAFTAYEHRLLYADRNRLFRLSDLTPEFRKRYGDITDREYYDYWAATGATAYATKRVWATNIQNKFRLSLLSHGVPHPDLVAWPMTASACLLLAEAIFDNAVDVCVHDFEVPKALLQAIFGQLNVHDITKRWDAAVSLLEPMTDTYHLDAHEQRNIQLGLDDLQEQWTSVATLTDALAETTEAYGEVFRTQGEHKKALRQVAEMRNG